MELDVVCRLEEGNISYAPLYQISKRDTGRLFLVHKNEYLLSPYDPVLSYHLAFQGYISKFTALYLDRQVFVYPWQLTKRYAPSR